MYYEHSAVLKFFPKEDDKVVHLETSFFIACYQMSDARILKSYRQMVVASIHITIKDYHKIRVKKEDPRVHKYYYQVTLKEFIIYAKNGKKYQVCKGKKRSNKAIFN